MKLDSAALRALNVFPTQQSSVKTHSLYGLLNKCKTAQGQRLLQQWLQQPLLDLARIKDRHDMVEALVDGAQLKSALVSLRARRGKLFFRSGVNMCLSSFRRRSFASFQTCHEYQKSLLGTRRNLLTVSKSMRQ